MTLQAINNHQENVPDAISAAFKHMGGCLAKTYANDWDKRKQDFQLVQMIAEKHSNILEFIEDYVLNPIYGSQVARSELNDKVTIITIHSAKGAESDVCYIIDVTPGSYPASWAIDDLDDVEEERRVLYVALTRAREELILTRRHLNTQVRQPLKKNESDVDSIESYFLNGLPEELVENHVHFPDFALSHENGSGAPIEDIELSINFE